MKITLHKDGDGNPMILCDPSGTFDPEKLVENLVQEEPRFRHAYARTMDMQLTEYQRWQLRERMVAWFRGP